FGPILRAAQYLRFAVIQVRRRTGAQALRGLFRISLVGRGDEKPRTRRPGAAKIGVFGESSVERSDRIAAIQANEIKRIVVMRQGGLRCGRGRIAITVFQHGNSPGRSCKTGETKGRQSGGTRATVSDSAPAAACQNTMTDTKMARARDMMFSSTAKPEHRARRWRKDYSSAPLGDRKLMVQRMHFLFSCVD